MKVFITLLLVVLIGGCGGGLGRSAISNFQIVEIDGKSYALDQRDGVLYEIRRTESGFDMSRQIGTVGF